MGKETQIRNQLEKYEKEYVAFMGIENFPKYKLEFYEIKPDKVVTSGFAAA